MTVRIQTNSFDVGHLIHELRQNLRQVGAIVTFSGSVREQGSTGNLTHLEVEFYPGMTEQAMADLEKEARQRWSLLDVLMIHRVGRLAVQEDIVCVVVLSQHRQDAFLAAEFLMDALKSTVPFWKKEIYLDKQHWVEAKESDEQAFQRWQT